MLHWTQRAPRVLLTVSLLSLVACADVDATPSFDALPIELDAQALRADAAADARAPGALDASEQLDAEPSPRDAASDGRIDAQAFSADATMLTPVDAGGLATMAIANAPTYLGTAGANSSCAQSYRTIGYAPADGVRHPLFLYFVGTAASSADQSARYDGKAPQRVNQAMAARGFVALSVEYDNAISSFLTDKQPCLFGSANAQSILAKACALPSVDCGLGIATWGHSQGGLLAHAAANYEPRVRAVWTTGYSGLNGAKLPFNRFRTVNAENDPFNGSISTNNGTAGFTSAECPEDGRDRCLRADGSGWIIVRKSACKTNAADHCWFNKRSCGDNAETLEPNWSDATSPAVFALEESADWVARTVARP